MDRNIVRIRSTRGLFHLRAPQRIKRPRQISLTFQFQRSKSQRVAAISNFKPSSSSFVVNHSTLKKRFLISTSANNLDEKETRFGGGNISSSRKTRGGKRRCSSRSSAGLMALVESVPLNSKGWRFQRFPQASGIAACSVARMTTTV